MSKLNPSMLTVLYSPPATEFRPVDRRKYTLTQSKTTGELFLCIGYRYDLNAMNKKFQDDVFAEWIPQLGQYVLSGKIYLCDDEFDEQYAKIRYVVCQREADLALSAIIYGDRFFFSNYPWLLDSPIYIHFESNYDEYNKLIYYGTPRQYLSTVIETIET